jgi:signal transduction histidine kinase
MFSPVATTILFSSLSLTFAISFTLLLLWHDPRRLTNLAFAWFILMVTLWSAGALMARVGALAGAAVSFLEANLRLVEFGFTGATLGLYLYVSLLTGQRSLLFQSFALASLLILVVYQAVLVYLGADVRHEVSAKGVLRYEFNASTELLFGLLSFLTMLVVWQSFRRIQRPTLSVAIILFALGQLTALISPRLQALALGENIAALTSLVMVFALVQAQIIQPLAGQTRQIEVVRDVGLAITSRLRLQSVLQTIAAQAAALLRADASLIFLRREGQAELILAAQYNIHQNILGHRIGLKDGLAGKVAQERRPFFVANYRREWRGLPDTPYAEQAFGSVIGVPLLFSDTVVGVLLVIQGQESRLFELEDVRLLELLAPQAAVAITNSRLFEQERALTSELEGAKTQLEAFLLTTNNPVLALNRRLEIIFANHAASQLLNTSAENLRQKKLLDLVPRTYLPQDVRQMLKDLRQRKGYIYQITWGGQTYLCHLARVRQPEAAWFAVLNDVSSIKELERLQRQMVELTTHQLKNPLQGAMLHLEELEDVGEEVLTDEMRHDLSVVWEQMDRMQKIIEGILNLERLQSRTKSREEMVDFGAVVRTVVSTLRRNAEHKAIQLECQVAEGLPFLRGDGEELSEAATNLVDNAIKYTPQGGKVNVNLTLQEGRLLLKVQDNGIGIPLAAQSQVFDRFFRAEQSGTEQISGTGIGLSLVKAIVEAHKGTIWLESQPKRGTTFFVSLPTADGLAQTQPLLNGKHA